MTLPTEVNPLLMSGGGLLSFAKKSLRFRSSASAYLSRTPLSASNSKTFTLSFWVKLGILVPADNRAILIAQDSVSTAYEGFEFRSDSFGFRYHKTGIGFYAVQTDAVMRDTSAWYHCVGTIDTTQATAANRIKFYINGVQQSVNGTQPDLNYDSPINSAVLHAFATYAGTGSYTDFYLAEINFIDGQALDPTYFGYYNAITGVWSPKAYSGSGYGTNGYYLPFSLSTTSSYAASFNGSTQSLALTANSSLQFGTGNFTVEGWYYQNGTVNYGNIFSTTSSYATTGGIRLSTGPNNNTFQVATGGSGLFNASSAFQASAWLHFAVVRNSGTTTLYVNGVSVGSAADTNSYTADTFRIGWVDGTSSSTYLLNGLLSNFRVVKGTAVYTANFTPPSSPLTAISGTSLLTLQDSTIIDNSTNNFSITNNGTVTTATATPFVANIFADASGNNNTWTGNNINYSSPGTTYDSMIDVPAPQPGGSLIPATQPIGNYAVLNPNDKDATVITFSDGNLTSTGYNGGGAASFGLTSGKWYWEITLNDSYNGGASNLYWGMFGVSSGKPNSYVSGYTGYPTGAGVYCTQNSGDGGTWASGSRVTTQTTWSNGDIVGFAFDATSLTLDIYRNNTKIGSTLTVPSGAIYPTWYQSGTSGDTSSSAANFGQRPYVYTPPSGYLSLCTTNMSAPTIVNGAKYMAATLYTGTGSALTVLNSTNSGNNPLSVSFQPDLVWVKSRSAATNHVVSNTITTNGNVLNTNTTTAETFAPSLYNIGSVGGVDGFLVQNYDGTTDTNGATYVAWQWKAGTGSTSVPTGGNITVTSASVNASIGFSILKYTGNGSTNQSVPHGLGVAPGMVVVKNLSNGTANWCVHHQSQPTGYTVYLNLTNAQDSGSGQWGSSAFTSSLFYVGYTAGATGTNNNGDNFMAWCWAPIAGYSAFGSYTGNGSADGPFVYTGFRPRWIMIKGSSFAGESWFIWDTSRNSYNLTNTRLLANTNLADNQDQSFGDILSNGFKLRNTWGGINGSSNTYIYAAFAENPFKYAAAR